MWNGALDTSKTIVVTGFMGTGKSTTGQLVAERLGRQFIDLDDAIEQRTGQTIPQIFQASGEALFRRIEQEVCLELTAQPHLVIATGGGTLVDERSRQHVLGCCWLVCLRATPDALAERLAQADDRPLVPRWRELLQQRSRIYAPLPHQIHTTGKPVPVVVEEILTLWQRQSP